MKLLNPKPARHLNPGLMRGLTLIELMVTVSIMMILVMVVAPSVNSFIESNKVRTTRDLLVQSIASGQEAAIRYHQDILLCPSSDGENCLSNWSANEASWLLFKDDDADSAPDPDEIMLIATSDNMAQIVFTNTSDSSSSKMKFMSTGHTDQVTYTIYAGSSGVDGWAITVNSMGSVTSEECSSFDCSDGANSE